MKALAAYKRNGKQCLIFPWATGGNLRETWAQLDSHKFRNAKLVPWVVRQLHGLSAARETLHEMKRRHGDLKPDNIVRFKNDNGFGLW
jgi:serine/threonine protein kinase